MSIALVVPPCFYDACSCHALHALCRLDMSTANCCSSAMINSATCYMVCAFTSKNVTSFNVLHAIPIRFLSILMQTTSATPTSTKKVSPKSHGESAGTRAGCICPTVRCWSTSALLTMSGPLGGVHMPRWVAFSLILRMFCLLMISL